MEFNEIFKTMKSFQSFRKFQHEASQNFTKFRRKNFECYQVVTVSDGCHKLNIILNVTLSFSICLSMKNTYAEEYLDYEYIT